LNDNILFFVGPLLRDKGHLLKAIHQSDAKEHYDVDCFLWISPSIDLDDSHNRAPSVNSGLETIMPFWDTRYFEMAFTIGINPDSFGSLSDSTKLKQNRTVCWPTIHGVCYLASNISHNDGLFHLFDKTLGIGLCKIIYAAE
jgi:hypothetical protein